MSSCQSLPVLVGGMEKKASLPLTHFLNKAGDGGTSWLSSRRRAAVMNLGFGESTSFVCSHLGAGG